PFGDGARHRWTVCRRSSKSRLAPRPATLAPSVDGGRAPLSPFADGVRAPLARSGDGGYAPLSPFPDGERPPLSPFPDGGCARSRRFLTVDSCVRPLPCSPTAAVQVRYPRFPTVLHARLCRLPTVRSPISLTHGQAAAPALRRLPGTGPEFRIRSQ